MRVVATGIYGVVGRALLPLMLPGNHDVVATDRTGGGAGWVAGDLTDSATLDRVLAEPCDALTGLATIAVGAAGADPEHAQVAAAAAGADPMLASHRPDPVPKALFGAHPPLDAGAARAAGLVDDRDLATLVANAFSSKARASA